MTDNNNNDNNNNAGRAPLTLGKGRLELKKNVEGSSVRQSLSQGRSKVVQVEVRKKRMVSAQITTTDDHISDDQAQKLKILLEAQKETEKEAAKRAAQETTENTTATSVQERQEKQEQRPDVIEAPKKYKPAERVYKRADDEEENEVSEKKQLKKNAHSYQVQPAARPNKANERRVSGNRVNFRQISIDGDEETDSGFVAGSRRGRSQAAQKRAREKARAKEQAGMKTPEKVFREVVVPETITVAELANRMTERAPTVIKELMKLGLMATINDVIDADTAELVVTELGHKIKRVNAADVEEGLVKEDLAENMLARAPVVTVMGHVDHGKTSLLDALRKTNVVKGEAGGITQHIGAYQITMENGRKVTFIDTPGHAAFTNMRARGAKVTDIVVLVVAANDGVMPQTIEAISHAKDAGVPIVVAINKIDMPGANPDRVRTELLSHGIVVESMGGDTMAVEVSAKNHTNLDKLIESILLQAEVLDLKADPDRDVVGVVIEAKVEKGRGPVATVLVQKGTLKVGDIFIAGNDWGKVRALLNENDARMDKAVPSTPVEVLGMQTAPTAGDDFIVVPNEEKARQVAAYRQQKAREAMMVKSAKAVGMSLFDKIKAGDVQAVPVIVKGDVQGSVEALNGILGKLATDKVKIRVVHSAIGAINESDIMLAGASGALIIGFNVRASTQAREKGKQMGVEIRYYSVVYNVIEDLKDIMAGKLEPEMREKFIGYAQVQMVFSIPKIGKIAGCMVTDGVVKRGAGVRLLRDDVVIYEGKLKSLQRMKDEVKDVRQGFDCGIGLENFEDIKVGDVIECFEMEAVAVKIDVPNI